jgi:hypothetical protein
MEKDEVVARLAGDLDVVRVQALHLVYTLFTPCLHLVCTRWTRFTLGTRCVTHAAARRVRCLRVRGLMARAAWAAWERRAEPPCGDSAKKLMGPRVGPGPRGSGLGVGPVGPDR